MDEQQKIATNEVICILKDRNWHELYEFHERYRLDPALICTVVDQLLAAKAIVKVGVKIKLSINMPNEIMAILNRAQKTTRPAFFDKIIKP